MSSTFPVQAPEMVLTPVASPGREPRTPTEMEAAWRQSVRDLDASRSELRSEMDRAWRLAANAFSVQGEACLTEGVGAQLVYFGDIPAETKIGMLAGSAPTSLEQLIAMVHPDDLEANRKTVEDSLTTGKPFRVIGRLADGIGGWRWLRATAFSLTQPNGKHFPWVYDAIDITDQKVTEAALGESVAELRRLHSQLQTENLFLREEVGRRAKYADIIGKSAGLARVLEQVELAAPTGCTVLISGETGTGKERIAAAIHENSAGRERLFVTVNCAALPATLVESELFGHERGAFTGAITRRMGRFEQANGGTIFLDEVGELPLEIQAKMLRVLQSGEFVRVGGDRPLKTNVRVIAATNRDLEKAVRDGQFRQDLYYRLAVFLIQVPSLRDRREDIPLLAAYFVARKSLRLGRRIERIPEASLNRLVAYDWPGNIREFENVIERAIILSPGTILSLDDIKLNPVFSRGAGEKPKPAACGDETLEKREREHISRICHQTAWKIKGPGGAAVILGIDPGTLYARMKKLGLKRPVADGPSSQP